MVKRFIVFLIFTFITVRALEFNVYDPKGNKIGTWKPCDSFDLSSLKNYNEFENPKLCNSFMNKKDLMGYVKKGCRVYGVLKTTKEGQSVKNMAGFIPSYDASMPYFKVHYRHKGKRVHKRYYQIERQPGDPVDVVCPNQI